MFEYDLLVYPIVAVWLSVFYFFYSLLGFSWKVIYYLLTVCVLYLMFSGASTVAIGIFLGLLTLPIWAAFTMGWFA